MNKHAQTLRAVIALLPTETRENYGQQISVAADEIDRLDTGLARHKEFAQILTQCAGGMVNGGILAAQTKELLEQT